MWNGVRSAMRDLGFGMRDARYGMGDEARMEGSRIADGEDYLTEDGVVLGCRYSKFTSHSGRSGVRKWAVPCRYSAILLNGALRSELS